jgi:hypothetical protein
MKNASRWNWNRGEYLREVGWFLGILHRLFTLMASCKKTKTQKQKITPKNPKKETVQFETGKKKKIRFSWRKTS